MSSVTVKDLNDLIETIQAKEAHYKEENDKVKILGDEIDSLYAKGAAFLDELGQKSFQSPHGVLKITERRSVKVPATDEDKEALFGWLKEKGIFERYATVNSRSLNSLYNAEYEEAEKSGEDMVLWQLPGVGQSSVYRTTNITKK